MGRHSISFKIALLLTAIITSMLALLFMFNTIYAERFYFANKQKQMVSRYNYINEVLLEYDAGKITQESMCDKIEQQMSNTGVSTIVVTSDWSTVYTNISGEAELVDRLRINMFNGDIFEKNPEKKENSDENADGENKPADSSQDNESTPHGDKKPAKPDKSDRDDAITIMIQDSDFENAHEIIAKEDKYTIQKSYDSRLGADFYELWGTVGNGDFIIMRMAVQSIKDNVDISNKLIAYIGIIILIVGVGASIIFSNLITKPILRLSKIAKRMANMDFDARYEGDDKSEIGVLGNSMNYMSDKLEENISQLKAANRELQRDIERKEKIDEMRTEFLSNVSHELKTPIALIQGYAEGLKEGITDDPESMDYYCDVIIDEAAKMNGMVKKLLTLNQIEFGNEELVMERFNIVELISSCVSANELRASQNGIKIYFSHEKEVMDVWSDEYKVEEVVTNYLTNAINHCEFDKIIKVDAVYNNDNVRVYVYNTGKPIPDEDIDKIWTKFYKVDKARTREYGGNGIGLSIVKAIMDSYGKEYGAENIDGGVCFWFDLDAKP